LIAHFVGYQLAVFCGSWQSTSLRAAGKAISTIVSAAALSRPGEEYEQAFLDCS
jgi:hypothetical protein